MRLLRAAARNTGITRRVRSLQARINFPRTIEIDGTVISLPTILGIRCRMTEPWMLDVLRRVLPLREGTFVDVGVNIGQTLIKLKAIDPDRRYVGFEPSAACVFYVQELIRENDFRDCTVLPIGLFSEDRLSVLNLYSDDPTNDAASLVGDRPNTVYSQVVVPLFRFESVAPVIDLGHAGVIKIDVEGVELDVVRTLGGLIEESRPIVLLEVLPVYSTEHETRKERQDELERIFNNIDYVMFRVAKTPSLGLDELQRIETIGIHSDMLQCDYVLVPREISTLLQSH